jgi:hypothetical protein
MLKILGMVAFSFAFSLGDIALTSAQQQQGTASPQCVACRNACVNARVSGNGSCCTSNGGQNAPSSCIGPRAPYAQCLQEV